MLLNTCVKNKIVANCVKPCVNWTKKSVIQLWMIRPLQKRSRH